MKKPDLVKFVPAIKQPLMLSIDTATRSGSVAVTRGETLLAMRSSEAAISHSSHLLDYVNGVLEESGVALEDVEIFAATAGPGSFTGLRIGLATIKSFAATLVRPCTGIPTLYAVARAAGESERTLALLPAGRGEVFAQLLRVDASGDAHPIDSPVHLTPRKLLEKVRAEARLKWTGEGAAIHADLIREHALAEGIEFRDETGSGFAEQGSERLWTIASTRAFLAVEVAGLALLRARAGEVGTPEQLRAIYVRPSDAELNVQGLE
jgi:tRNA threonylcarbamoyladenosine biosynthesis protein TsaB